MASNHALKVRSVGNYCAIYEPNDGNLAATNGSMCVAFWLRLSDEQPVHKYLLRIMGNNSWWLTVYGSPDPTYTDLVANCGGNAATWSGGLTTIDDDEWHLVVVEADYSGGAGSGIVRVWVDGDVKAENTGNTWTAPTAFTQFYVGTNGVGSYADADIDELCIFDGYSTEAERDALYNSGDGVKPITDAHLANGTLTFRAGFDENSATADYAVGTAAPISGSNHENFVNGFWFGQATGFETTDRGPDELWHVTDGYREYAADIEGNAYGYDDWSVLKGAYSTQVGRMRVVEDDGDLDVRGELWDLKWPHYLHVLMQTDGLGDGEYVRLQAAGDTLRTGFEDRCWHLDIYSDKVVGKDSDHDVEVDTEAWLDIKVLANWHGTAGTARAVINDEYEVVLTAGTSPSIGNGELAFVGSGLTTDAWVEVARLAIHGIVKPSVKKTHGDTFPDEMHLYATSNAGRVQYDHATDHPWKSENGGGDKGLIWTPQADTWSDGRIGVGAGILDTANDRLLLWGGGKHGVEPWPDLENGQFRYNSGTGYLPLDDWPDVSIADGVGATQNEPVTLRPATPYRYCSGISVVDAPDGNRYALFPMYHLPVSPNYVGQCRSEVVVGTLTDKHNTVDLLYDGAPVITQCKPPSHGDLQINAGGIIYNPDAPLGMEFQMWGQAYGDRNTWGAGGASEPLRGLYLAVGATPTSLHLWPSTAAILVSMEGTEGGGVSLRWGDDYLMWSATSGGARWIYTLRGRGPFLFHVGQRWDAFHGGTAIRAMVGTDDPARGIWHCTYHSDINVAYAYMRIDGFDWIGIDEAQTTGYVETVDIQKPSGGWGSLHINVDADDTGQKLEVAVIDPDTGSEVSGYRQADCDDVVVDDTDKEVTWAGAKLSARTEERLRLRFHVTRANPVDPTPRLYSYRVADWPTVTRAPKTVRPHDLTL